MSNAERQKTHVHADEQLATEDELNNAKNWLFNLAFRVR
jgi:hypothetical protein